MSRHFRPGRVTPITLSKAERRRLQEVFGGPQRQRLSGTIVAVVLAMAAFVGLAAGLSPDVRPAPGAVIDTPSDKPILWDEVQPVPRAEVAAEDAAWAAGGSGSDRQAGATQASASRSDDGGEAHIPFFGYCHYGGGSNCVVDGDTFYFGRAKVRIAGIDAPETHPARCPSEARLGAAATHRLRDLLNGGDVSLSRIDRDEDVFGRKLRNVAVGGADVGAVLVSEGLARDYAGGRKSWCAS